jgi:inner membrane protein
LLDLTNSAGVKLLWPFGPRWFAWDLAQEVDPGLLVILLAGLLLPALLHLVGEDFGARNRKRPGARGAVIALCLAAAYFGGRALAHEHADALLNARTYRQETPIRAAAFPTVSPLLWRGVVETQTAMHQVEMPLAPGAAFDPRLARSQFKPDDSPALQRAVESDAARAFLVFARFPLARVHLADNGFEVRLGDLRQSAAGAGANEIVAVVLVNARGEVTSSRVQFDGPPR